MNRELTKVLVVDDDPDLAIQIRHMLRQSHLPYEVHAEYGVENLSARLSRDEFDVWILDHQLAGIDGRDVLKRLTDGQERPPFVVLTMSMDPQLSQMYLDLGAADFLNKEELRPALLERTLRYAIAHDGDRRNIDRQQQQLLRYERMATIGRIASGVAHEYNNLNAVVLAALERLQRKLVNDSDSERFLNHIIEAVQRSSKISDSLLKLGRKDEPKGTITDLSSTVRELMTLLSPQVEKAGVALRVTCQSTHIPVAIDAQDLHQVLNNLIINGMHAVHATPEPLIEVILHREDEQAYLTVSDNGVGIAAEDIPRVCQPFFSRKGPHDKLGLFPRNAQGTGLGLAVCQSLIENSGGQLELSSTPGRGTSITMTLPIACLAKSTVPSQVGAAEARAHYPLTVAVVDDNEYLCELLDGELSHAGFITKSFTSPTQFLRECSAQHFDALVLDWQMPGVSGADLIGMLDDAARQTPISTFIISGTIPTLPSPMPSGIQLRKVLAKPFLIKELIGLINELQPAQRA